MDFDDINVEIQNDIFTCRTSAFIVKDGKILFQKRKGDKVWALPGGKLKIMERAEDGVRREIKEELGCDFINLNLLSVTENFFEMNNKKSHQYIFNFSGELDTDIYNDKIEFDSIEKEKNVIYRWIEIEKLDEFEVRPDNIKEQIDGLNKGIIKFFKCEG